MITRQRLHARLLVALVEAARAGLLVEPMVSRSSATRRRRMAQTERMAFAAARSQLVATVVRPRTVAQDRSVRQVASMPQLLAHLVVAVVERD
jgi:hypothetical protein